MKKELKEGMGFICETLEDKKRIWQKLTDAGYPMYCEYEDSDESFICVLFDNHKFMGSEIQHVTHPLNESDFFDEWTPKAGEMITVSGTGFHKQQRKFVVKHNNLYFCEKENQPSELFGWAYAEQIKPETMTLQEVREALGKPNLIVTQ
jgi:hypothetical protein